MKFSLCKSTELYSARISCLLAPDGTDHLEVLPRLIRRRNSKPELKTLLCMSEEENRRVEDLEEELQQVSEIC